MWHPLANGNDTGTSTLALCKHKKSSTLQRSIPNTIQLRVWVTYVKPVNALSSFGMLPVTRWLTRLRSLFIPNVITQYKWQAVTIIDMCTNSMWWWAQACLALT